jgi:hypothetical protein
MCALSVVNFKLTESGQGVLEAAEGQQPMDKRRTPTVPAGFPELLEGSAASSVAWA